MQIAGLPGTGKSLLIRELAHLAHAGGRRLHLLQWDRHCVDLCSERCQAGRRGGPQEAGVTHGVIRLAAGRWRPRFVAWHARHRGAEHLPIGETPFIGHRLVYLARPLADVAEPPRTAPGATFRVPVPPHEQLRAHLEAERGNGELSAAAASARARGRAAGGAPPGALG